MPEPQNVPHTELVLTPTKCVSGENVRVNVRLRDRNPSLTYRIQHWFVSGGKLRPRPPRVFPPGADEIELVWETLEMSQGEHAVVFTLAAMRNEELESSFTAAAELLVQPFSTDVLVRLLDAPGGKEVSFVSQGRVIWVEAELTKMAATTLDYEFNVTAGGGRVKAERTDETSSKWLARLPTNDLPTGEVTVRVFVKTTPVEAPTAPPPPVPVGSSGSGERSPAGTPSGAHGKATVADSPFTEG